jgi:hypothetical protein
VDPDRSSFTSTQSTINEQEEHERIIYQANPAHQAPSTDHNDHIHDHDHLCPHQSSPELRCREYQPVEYHRVPITYSYLKPPKFISDDDETTKGLATLAQWRRRVEDVAAYNATHPNPIVPVTPPEYVWHSQEENMFQLWGPPRYCLRVGDEIDCYGLMTGKWRLTRRRERRHHWKGERGSKEWVYVMCQNDVTNQDTWLKMEARFFYLTTLGIKVRKSMQKLITLLPRRLLTKPPRHHSESST